MSRESNRFVLDTNALVSALLFTNSVPGQAFRKALRNGVILESSEAIQELENVLSRKKNFYGMSLMRNVIVFSRPFSTK